jgi:hypothetical protein
VVDPFDDTSWDLPPLALELEALAVAAPRGPGGDHATRAVDWACAHLRDGADPRSLCEAALWCGLRNGRTEGRGPYGLVTHAVLAAHASAALGALAIGDDGRTAALAAVGLCAYTAGAYRGGVNDPAEGPSRLAWFEPTDLGDDPVEAFLELAGSGETDLVDHAWLAAAAADPVAAEQALISAAAAGYQLNEHKLVYPAQLRAWAGDDAPLHPTLWRAAARYAGNHLQSPGTAESRRADAAALAEMVDAPAPDGDHDLARVSVVATGIARTWCWRSRWSPPHGSPTRPSVSIPWRRSVRSTPAPAPTPCAAASSVPGPTSCASSSPCAHPTAPQRTDWPGSAS